MLEEILKSIVLEVAGEKKQKNAIGVINDDLRQEFKNLIEEKEELVAELKYKHERLSRKIEKELFEEFGPRLALMDEEKDKLWEKIRNDLCVMGNPDLNINTRTGVISEWIKKSK